MPPINARMKAILVARLEPRNGPLKPCGDCAPSAGVVISPPTRLYLVRQLMLQQSACRKGAVGAVGKSIREFTRNTRDQPPG